MTKRIDIFNSVSGLNTRVDNSRLKMRDVDGLTVAELAVASNIEVLNGGIRRRKGMSKKVSGEHHSLYIAGEYALVIQGTNLKIMERDYSSTTLRTVTINQPMSYAQIKDTIYYSNGIETGYVKDRINYAWDAEDYAGPNTTREFLSPPPGHLLCVFNGRMYIAQEILDGNGEVHHALWHSEPFAYSWVDYSEDLQLIEHKIVTLTAIPDSLIVGTTGGIYSYIGTNPFDFVVKKLTDAPAIAETAVRYQADTIGDGQMTGDVVLITTHEGVCLVGPGGYFSNLTYRKINMPSYREGAAGIINNRYICSLSKGEI